MVVYRRNSCDLCSSMWEYQRSALQTLHKVSSKAREQNYFQGGPTHDWVNYYEQHIESDRSCLNEWHAMDSLESRRPPSPDSVRNKPRERDETERVIRATLKEIMMSVDLDEVTSKYIRSRLEEDLDMDLGEFKSFIDQEMLTILGQMDAPTEIFEHVYLGSEWNASNFEELQKNGVGHILNVTREIDNFFPGMFDYLNIRVYDDEKTDLLKYWDNTFKYITKARKEGSKVLVHCKMGVSRSASVVIAYAMKAYNWNFEKALKHVREKRSCIKPNTSFIAQLETYQGILDAMKNKEKLQRSKSETNLKSPELVSKSEKRVNNECNYAIPFQKMDEILQNTMSGHDLRTIGARPKSWSPDYQIEQNIPLERIAPPVFLSLENLSKDNSSQDSLNAQTSPEVRRKSSSCPSENARHVLMPLNNGQSYSVSPNQIVHICKKQSVKHRIIELESQSSRPASKKLTKDKKNLVLNLTTQFESSKTKSCSPTGNDVEMIVVEESDTKIEEENSDTIMKLVPPMLTAKLLKKEIWDPGESNKSTVTTYGSGVPIPSCENCDSTKLTAKDSVVWTSSTVVKQSVPLLNSVENPKLNNSAHNDNVNMPTPEVFCSKTVLGVIGNISNNKVVSTTRKEGDPFSSQVDRVFDREERKQQRNSIIVPTAVVPPPAPCTTEVSHEDVMRECPSRQSSWSSYDSAVVLGYQGETRDAPSRHSSWGSGDTRTLPSRNSSWGSYDMRPNQSAHVPSEKGDKIVPHRITSELFESTSSGIFPYDRDEIPWHPGTVKRTKQKLERNRDIEKRSSQDVKNVESIENLSTNNNPLANIQTHKSPSTETLTSDYSVSVISENEGPAETYNTGLLHYQSSPDLCETKKDSQRVISSLVDQPFHSPNAISKEIDIISDSKMYSNPNLTSGSRLSVSAPETSSINLISNDGISLSSSSATNISTIEKRTDMRHSKSVFETPSVIYTAQCSSVKNHKNYLENLLKETEFATRRSFQNDSAQNENESSSSSSSSFMSGIVKSLKKEFEAKTSTKPEFITIPSDNISPDCDSTVKPKVKGSSLPSSPTNNTFTDCSSTADESRDSVEDISVRELVGKYEEVGTIKTSNNKTNVTTPDTQVIKSRSLFDNKLFSANQNKNMRYSCIEMMSDTANKHQAPMLISTSIYQHNNTELSAALDSISKLPPVSTGGPLPSVVMATVVKAATKKQKHKKDSHTCLNIKPRNNNPVYNTM